MTCYLKIYSDPVLIFHMPSINENDTGEDYLHFPFLIEIGSIRNEVKVTGGQQNANVDCKLNNMAMIDGVPACTELLKNPPLKKRADIVHTVDGILFTGNVTRVKLGIDCIITVEG